MAAAHGHTGTGIDSSGGDSHAVADRTGRRGIPPDVGHRSRCRPAAQRAVHRLRRFELFSRVLRRSDREDAPYRPARRPRRAIRAGLLHISALRSEPQLVSHRPLSECDRHPDQRPDLPAVDPEAALDAAGVSPRGLFRRPGRQDVSLQRADVGRHQRPRRPWLVGARDQPRWGRPARGGAEDLLARARKVWRHAELVCLAEGRPRAHRRHHGRRCGLGARTLRP